MLITIIGTSQPWSLVAHNEGVVEIKCDKQGVKKMSIKAPSLDEVMNKKRPEKKFKSGPISTTIWSNEGKNDKGEVTTFKTISFDRSYLDKDGNWKKTTSLRASDLPKAVLVLQKAYEYLSLDDESIDTEEL